MTRKIFSVILVFAVLLFTTACGKDDGALFTHGTWSDDHSTYTSEFLGLQLNFPLLWFPIGDENLAKTAGIEDMSGSSMKTVLDKGKPIYEAIVINVGGRSVIIMVYDNTKNTAMKEENFFDQGQTVIKGNYIDGGYTCVGGKSSVYCLGKYTDCLELRVNKDGKDTYYITVPIFKGNFTACIEFGSQDKSELSTIYAMAKAI